jgi:hypothetical protein
MTNQDYSVGRGKPPVEGQFKKGRSGNPGGKPRKRPTFERQLRIGLEQALVTNYRVLAGSEPIDCMAKIAQKLVLGAAAGDLKATKYLLSLTDRYDLLDTEACATKVGVGTVSALKDLEHYVSLSEGNIQGNPENDPAGDEEEQSEQDVNVTAAPASGNGTETAEPPEAECRQPDGSQARPPDEADTGPLRPNRSRIEMAGSTIQEGGF